MEEKSDSCFSNKNLFIGIDVHKKRWVLTVRTYDLELKTYSMQPSADTLEKFLVTNYPGATYKIVYECFINKFWGNSMKEFLDYLRKEKLNAE